MNYLFYALIAYAFWAISIIFDKILRSKQIKDSTTLVIIFGFANLLPFIFLLPFINIQFPSLQILLISLFTGFLMIIAVIPYLNSLSMEEASRVAPLWHFSPMFVLILAFFFLNEKLTTNSYIGFFLLLFGGLLISTRKIKSIFKINNVFWLMLISSLMFAVSEIFTKFIYKTQDYWNGIFWIILGFPLGSLVLLLIKKHRVNFKNTISNLKKKSILFLLGSSLTGFFGRVFYFIAIMLGSVSLAAVTGGFEGFFVLIYAIILSHHLPKLFKEEVDKKIILHKIIAISLMFIGLIFVYI